MEKPTPRPWTIEEDEDWGEGGIVGSNGEYVTDIWNGSDEDYHHIVKAVNLHDEARDLLRLAYHEIVRLDSEGEFAEELGRIRVWLDQAERPLAVGRSAGEDTND